MNVQLNWRHYGVPVRVPLLVIPPVDSSLSPVNGCQDPGLLVQVHTFWTWKLDCMMSLGVIHGISQVTPTNMRCIIKPLWCWILSVTLLVSSRAVFRLCSCCYFHLSCFIFISKEFCFLVWSWFFLFFFLNQACKSYTRKAYIWFTFGLGACFIELV